MKKTDRLQQAIKAKLHASAGESIVETLVTMIILSLAVIMLSGAVVTSARVNQKADNTDTAFVTDEETTEDGTVKISASGGNATDAVSLKVNVHKTKNGYTYYEPQ